MDLRWWAVGASRTALGLARIPCTMLRFDFIYSTRHADWWSHVSGSVERDTSQTLLLEECLRVPWASAVDLSDRRPMSCLRPAKWDAADDSIVCGTLLSMKAAHEQFSKLVHRFGQHERKRRPGTVFPGEFIYLVSPTLLLVRGPSHR